MAPRSRYLVGQHAAAGAIVRGIAPERLHRESGSIHRDIGRGTLARANPRTLVPVLAAGTVEPAPTGEDVGPGLAALAAPNAGTTGVRTRGVDKTCLAARSGPGVASCLVTSDVADELASRVFAPGCWTSHNLP